MDSNSGLHINFKWEWCCSLCFFSLFFEPIPVNWLGLSGLGQVKSNMLSEQVTRTRPIKLTDHLFHRLTFFFFFGSPIQLHILTARMYKRVLIMKKGLGYIVNKQGATTWISPPFGSGTLS